jgi:dCMP deaminase
MIDTWKWDQRFLGLAKVVSTWSKDPSTQTGAVIVRPDKTIASLGYNGFAKPMPDALAYLQNREEKYSRIIHCEMNAILHAKESMEGYCLYTYPLLSCDRCCVHMLQVGIRRFVAPRLPESKQDRWKESLERSKFYMRECGAEIVELEFE